jgi:hypothetical protein
MKVNDVKYYFFLKRENIPIYQKKQNNKLVKKYEMHLIKISRHPPAPPPAGREQTNSEISTKSGEPPSLSRLLIKQEKGGLVLRTQSAP